VLESITILIIKEKLSDIWRVIKKYWQFFLGMSVAVIFFILTRDTSKASKALEQFRKSSKDERERSLEIQEDKQSDIEKAVDEFSEDINSAAEDLSERSRQLEEEKERIKNELLEKEEKERGSIAEEISETLDKI